MFLCRATVDFFPLATDCRRAARVEPAPSGLRVRDERAEIVLDRLNVADEPLYDRTYRLSLMRDRAHADEHGAKGEADVAKDHRDVGEVQRQHGHDQCDTDERGDSCGSKVYRSDHLTAPVPY